MDRLMLDKVVGVRVGGRILLAELTRYGMRLS